LRQPLLTENNVPSTPDSTLLIVALTKPNMGGLRYYNFFLTNTKQYEKNDSMLPAFFLRTANRPGATTAFAPGSC
jgi:hypothetical protein